MAGVRPHQDGLAGHGGSEGDDLGALFAFIGPTDLTLLSSAVDGDPALLEGHVAQNGVDFIRIFGDLRGAASRSPHEFDLDSFGLEQPMVLGHQPGKAKYGAADLAGRLDEWAREEARQWNP